VIVIVDYGIGNLGSVHNMLRRIGAESCISADPDVVAGADKVIIPGVGAFDTGMANLAERGLIPALQHAANERKVPALGFCLGMQLLVDGSEEGVAAGLGWIPGRCVRLRPAEGLRVPHMAWNRLEICQPSHPLVQDLGERPRFYFVHSYQVVCDDPTDVVAVADYGGPVTAVIARDNVWATQFHPEKSHKFGMALLGNFVRA